jgi:hypothetical protein
MFSGNPSSSELENGDQKDPSKTLLTKEDLEGIKKSIANLINPENIIDGDGNPYTPIIIGGQMWLTENLKTTNVGGLLTLCAFRTLYVYIRL